MGGGHYVRLYAPRKYGKTSLLKRDLRDGDKIRFGGYTTIVKVIGRV